MNPALKALVFEDFINKTRTELDDYSQVVLDFMSHSDELAGEVFNAPDFLTKNRSQLKDMFLKNIRPVQAAQTLISGIKRQY